MYKFFILVSMFALCFKSYGSELRVDSCKVDISHYLKNESEIFNNYVTLLSSSEEGAIEDRLVEITDGYSKSYSGEVLFNNNTKVLKINLSIEQQNFLSIKGQIYNIADGKLLNWSDARVKLNYLDNYSIISLGINLKENLLAKILENLKDETNPFLSKEFPKNVKLYSVDIDCFASIK